MDIEQQAKIASEDFMNIGVDIDDPYWKLFEVKNQVNDALVKAVQYGFEQGFKAAKKREEQIKKGYPLREGESK